MVEVNPIVMAFVLALLGFVLFVYLFIRRTVTAYREGQDQGRRR